MAELADTIKKCISLLQGAKSDTEKFAALFLVAKLKKSKDLNGPAKKALFEAIGFPFLKKLLTTTKAVDDCPPSVYKSVALSVLTNFCNEPELATHPDMLANIPLFLSIVQKADDDDDNLIIVSEAYTCLQCIAAHDAGQKALIDVGAIAKMSEIYSNQSFQTDEALNILVQLVSRYGPKAWGDDPKPFNSLVNKIALDFETDHSDRKFELASILSALLYSCNKNTVIASASEETWPASIYKALSDILMSKIGKNQRDPALKLAANIVDLLGIEWTLAHNPDEDSARKFFLLLLQLSAIEVRMQMDEKSFKQAFANSDLITSCFIVLELAINYMAADNIDLEQKEKQSVYTALKGAFNGVVSVLLKVSNDKNKDKLTDAEKVFICGMIRVLSAWIAQETTAMRDKVYDLLPFMLSFANDSFHAYRLKKLAEKNKSAEPMETDSSLMGQVDILRIMLPALCHLVVEDKARQIVLSVKEEEVLYECVTFNWDIVHYKKPPIPKSERGKVRPNQEPELSPKVLEDMKDSRAAMVSLCNIFMNLTVLEPRVVDKSITFNNLLKFIFNNLPELKNIPENLVLHGHMAVLGLLLLKQQTSKIKKNDFSICRYIQSTIRFLWDAYVIDESGDPEILVVAMSYKESWSEIADLWFLGMQTMSGVLSLVPWISEFAIESGWAEGIVTMMVQVKVGTLPPNVKSAFEDFLSHLVDANQDVIPVLKKAGALKMCRNHRLMDLGKKLFGD